MTISPDARTPSASVHALSGSTPPGAGATMQPFGVATAAAAVHELPDTFAPLGTAAADVVAGLAARRAAAAHPDAAVIDLAERLAALAPRQDGVLCRHVTINSRVDEWDFANKPEAPAERPSRIIIGDLSTTTHRIMQVSTPLEADGVEREETEAYAAACKTHRRAKRRRLARTRAPYLRKLADRMRRRMSRWSIALTEMEPKTREGQAAKAAAAVAVAATADDLDWGKGLLLAANRDAVRLACVRPPCAELARLVVDWRAAEKAAYAADDRREGIAEALVLPDPPEALRFRAATDETCIGGYQNNHQPYGYTDPKQVAQLRAGVAAVHQPRADEIVAAFDAWTAACEAAREAAGLPDADAAWERTLDAEVALRRRIIATPAASAEDLRLKAEVAVWCYGTLADVENDLAEAARDGHWGDTTASTAMLLDVMRLLDADALPAAVLPPSNLRPAPLVPLALPAPRYPAGTSRDVVESYRTFLDMELRFLNHEVYGQTEGGLPYWLDNPAGSFHGGGEPAPSTRAATVLSALGLMPGATAEEKRETEERAA